jgi:hypothetical protein
MSFESVKLFRSKAQAQNAAVSYMAALRAFFVKTLKPLSF